jgi:hypothetical protein
MPRAPRQFYAGAYYHVNTRGNNKARVYIDGLDHYVFVRLLERSVDKYEWVVYAWCLMTNHYHFVVRISEGGLSEGMSELNGSFGAGQIGGTGAATTSSADVSRAGRSSPTLISSRRAGTSSSTPYALGSARTQPSGGGAAIGRPRA